MPANELEGQMLVGGESDPTNQLLALIDHSEQALFNFARALAGDNEIALDAVQDAFLAGYENLQNGKPVNATWLYTVARNRVIDALRQRQRIQPDLTRLSDMPSESMCSSPKTQHARDALDRLGPSDRELLYLFLVDKFAIAEIAEMLGIRVGAVKVRLMRARYRFRCAL